jgi:hypothetical protein
MRASHGLPEHCGCGGTRKSVLPDRLSSMLSSNVLARLLDTMLLMLVRSREGVLAQYLHTPFIAGRES